MEVELRARINNKEDIVNKLISLGCTKIATIEMIDHYYQSINPEQQCFIYRIRVTNDGVVFTFKKGEEGAWIEREVLISDAAEMNEILLNSFFEKFLTIKKIRETYKLGELTINIDNLIGKGLFIEVEIISDNKDESEQKIKSFMINKLSIPEEDITNTGYVRMFMH